MSNPKTNEQRAAQVRGHIDEAFGLVADMKKSLGEVSAAVDNNEEKIPWPVKEIVLVPGVYPKNVQIDASGDLRIAEGSAVLYCSPAESRVLARFIDKHFGVEA